MSHAKLIFVMIISLFISSCSSETAMKMQECNEAGENLSAASNGSDRQIFDQSFQKVKESCSQSAVSPDVNIAEKITAFFSKTHDYDTAVDYIASWHQANGFGYMGYIQAIEVLDVTKLKAANLYNKNPTEAQRTYTQFEKSLSNYQLSSDEYYQIISSSLNYRYLAGERSRELVLEYKALLNSYTYLFRDQILQMPFYDQVIPVAQQVGDKKSAAELIKQKNALTDALEKMRKSYPYEQGEDGVPEQYYQKQISRIEIISSYLKDHGEKKLADVWAQQIPSLQQNIQTTSQSRAAAESAAASQANESNDDSSALVSQIVGVISAGIIAEASGGNGMQAINSGLADMAVNNSDNPELMSSVRSGLDTMAQAANKCDYSTPSGFKSCCKNQIKGKLSSTSNSDGTVSYGCLHPDKIGTREGCTYSGNTMVNVCAISP